MTNACMLIYDRYRLAQDEIISLRAKVNTIPSLEMEISRLRQRLALAKNKSPAALTR
jgi:hypothetical protein